MIIHINENIPEITSPKLIEIKLHNSRKIKYHYR